MWAKLLVSREATVKQLARIELVTLGGVTACACGPKRCYRHVPVRRALASGRAAFRMARAAGGAPLLAAPPGCR